MAETSAKLRYQKRREARQRKILASAGDRLSRITATVYDEMSNDYKVVINSPSSSVLAASPPSSPLESKFPEGALVETPLNEDKRFQAPFQWTQSQTSFEGYKHPYSHYTHCVSPVRTSQPFSPVALHSSPRIARSTFAPEIINTEDGFFGHGPILCERIASQRAMSSTSPSYFLNSEQPTSPIGLNDVNFKRRAFCWRVVHMACALTLGMHFVIRELWREKGGIRRLSMLGGIGAGESTIAPAPLLGWFTTLELILLSSSHFFISKTRESSYNTLNLLIAILPPAASNTIRFFCYHRDIYDQLWRDISVLLFVFGLAVMGARYASMLLY
ncbi:uncharacterized protein VTP21DRAFT_1947 [Calcarisporiella thermophila]|uniref:uncharacterized protein n=1 Tax=Calcarisporiella thermophila TaxID=911321 RepID=UPI003743C910